MHNPGKLRIEPIEWFMGVTIIFPQYFPGVDRLKLSRNFMGRLSGLSLVEVLVVQAQ